MGGLLTHLSISLGGFLIIWAISKKYYYGLAFGIGHLAPDLIDFGITGLRMGSMNPSVIMTHAWFEPLMLLGHTFWHWVIFGIVFLLVIGILERYKKISGKTHMKWLLILVYFLIGVAVHLVIDLLVIEKSYWI
jgi:hypothetical protein